MALLCGFSPPESTGEMIALGEYMLNVKNKVMHTLNEEIECSKGIWSDKI